MLATRKDPVVVVHFDPRDDVPETPNWVANRADASLTPVLAYGPWARRQGYVAWLVIPDSVRRRYSRSAFGDQYDRVIVLRDELDLPPPPGKGKARAWIINGLRLPALDFANLAAGVGRRSDEVMVFSHARAMHRPHYGETVSIDDGGRVLRFRRHYHDSPLFAERWADEPIVLNAPGAQVPAVLAHLRVHGWGLQSIGALSRRYAVRWSELPAGGSAVTTAPTADWTDEPGPSILSTSRWPELDADSEPFDLTSADSWTGVSPSQDSSPSGDETIYLEDFEARPRASSGYEAAKRALDVAASAIGLAVLAPFLLLVAATIKLTSRGPVFFVHRRQGRGGKEFCCLKFRTMRVGADRLQDSLRAFNEVDGPQFKIEDDPRLTCVGRWLRRKSIDELPQLLNVLVGQMSLVGPRPSPDDENQLCPAWRRARLSLKPGMTGLWQVLRRRTDPDMDFQEWIYYDVEYTKHRCFWLDWQILLHTPLAIFASHRLVRFVEKLQRRGVCRHAEEMGWPTSVSSRRDDE